MVGERAKTLRPLLALAFLAPWGWLPAQGAPARPFHENVTLPVDGAAAKMLLTIDDRWQAGRWQEALPDLISLCESQGHVLVQTDRGETSGVGRYQSVALACERWLATLGPEELALYQRQVQPLAERLWSHGSEQGRPELLALLTRRYRYTPAASQACDWLAERAWQQGDVAQARQWWRMAVPPLQPEKDTVRTWEGDLTRSSPDTAARLILCDWLLGHPGVADQLQAFQLRFPEAMGQLGSQTGRWSELLSTALRQPPGSSLEFSGPGEVTTFAGKPSRQSQSHRLADLGSELWSVVLPGVIMPRSFSPSVFPSTPALPYYPAVVDDIVYVNDGARIWAWNLYSGRPAYNSTAEGSALIFPPLNPEQVALPRRAVRGQPLWTVTVGNGRLYAVLGSTVTTPSPLELRDQSTQLICLDLSAGEGRLLWRQTTRFLTSQAADDPEPADPLPDWTWEGSPLLVGDRLYVALSRRRPQLEWSIACLEAETGRLLWHQGVGVSRPAPADHENLASHLLLAEGDGALFLSTHWGLIASVDLLDGQLRWAATYASEAPFDRDPIHGFAGNLPVVSSEGVFVAPRDTRHLYCFDPRSGVLLWKQPLIDRVDYLLGVLDGKLIASGTGLYAFDAATGQASWEVVSDQPEFQGFGRGWLAGHAVVWPCRTALSIVEASTGRLLREVPLETADASRQGGHVLQVGGVTIIASSDRLSVLGEYSLLRKQNSDWLSEHPTEIRSQLRAIHLSHESDEVLPLVSSLLARDSNSFGIPASTLQQTVWSWMQDRLLRSSPASPRREVYAQLTHLAGNNPLALKLIEHERVHATDVDWRVDVLHRWLALQARAPPDHEREVTAWQVRRQLQRLRSQGAAPLFARVDAQARQHRQEARTNGEPRADQHLARLFPTFPELSTLPPDSSDSPQIPRQDPTDAINPWQVVDHRIWSVADANRSHVASRNGPESGDSLGLWVVLPEQGLRLYCQATQTVGAMLPLDRAPEFVAGDGIDLWIASATHVFCLKASDSRLLWREPLSRWPWSAGPSRTSRTTRWSLLSDQLLECVPHQSLRSFDRTTGEIRWQRSLAGREWHDPCLLSGHGILAQEPSTSTILLLDPASGQVLTQFRDRGRPWVRVPAWSPDATIFATVDDQGIVAFFDREGQFLSAYPGVVTTAHQPPRLVVGQRTWGLLIDGWRWAPLDRNGAPQAAVRAIASVPLQDDPANWAVQSERLTVVEEQTLVTYDLRSGERVWTADVPTVHDPQLAPCRTSDALFVLGRVGGERAWRLFCWSSTTGRLLQTVHLPLSETARPRLFADDTGVLILSDRELVALVRRPLDSHSTLSTRLAD